MNSFEVKVDVQKGALSLEENLTIDMLAYFIHYCPFLLGFSFGF